ncbi:winged helix-turn-helix domain-containing protein [Streptomyces sp. NPDC004528]|uniref:winged helix-turn-helix domain-containing protein n=1 Tax=Streptomyces sp. NPDC004528 TaxID=3154550 RepID=UPI0033B6E62B
MVEWTGKQFAYQQVANDLRRRIAADEFGTGQLPSFGDLQKTYGVTVTVARTAISQLKADGLVVSHQGKGVFLTPDAGRSAAQLADPVEILAELRDEVDRLRTEVGELRQRVTTLEGN